MNSHEYAVWLKKLAEFLLSRPQFELYLGLPKINCYFGHDKTKFLRAAKALVENRVQVAHYRANIISIDTVR